MVALLNSKTFKGFLKVNVGILLAIVVAIMVLIVPNIVHGTNDGIEVAQTEQEVTTVETEEEAPAQNNGGGARYIAAALAVGFSVIGAAYAVAVAVSSAIGAASENPELMGKTLIFVGLAEGIALYGMIVAFMILLI